MTSLGLTQAELDAVEKNWQALSGNLKTHGVQIFVLLFKKYPDYQNFFKQFKDLPLAEVAKSSKLRAHGSTFMHGLSAMMDALDDPETLTCLIQNNVERHFTRNIRFQHYQRTLDLFPDYLKETLGDDLTGDAVSGWNKVLNLIKDVMKTKVEELEARDCEK